MKNTDLQHRHLVTQWPAASGLRPFWKFSARAVLALVAGFTAVRPAEAAGNLAVWDTGSHAAAADVAGRAAWKSVPRNLFSLEAEPLKAASDPGYYGLEYSFKGDAVVENRKLAAVFSSATGRVVFFSKTGADGDAGSRVLEFAPLAMKAQAAKISRCEILHHAGDEVAVEAFFSSEGSAEMSAVITFGKNEIVEIKPSAKMKGVALLGQISHGVVPGFVGDDLILSPAAFPSAESLAVPAENVFIGLLGGGRDELVMTWPAGKQQMKLHPAAGAREKNAPGFFDAVEFDNDGQSFYLAVLSAPGIWHREELKSAYLEKDVELPWKRPFSARWKTQLSEGENRTTYAFREAKGTVWRGVAGSYLYPAWFDGEKAMLTLGKKVPPRGEAIVYFLEGSDTPPDVLTPTDVMKATLGRPVCDAILDIAGRRMRTHHRRGGEGVHRSCTCGCTEAIQAIFEAAEEVTKKDHVSEALADMNYFVEQHLARIDEYRRFADAMIAFLKSKETGVPEIKSFAEAMQQIVQQIPQGYDVQKENMKSLQHAAELTHQTMALTGSSNPKNLAAYKDLLKAWRAMGGAQDSMIAQCHATTRSLFQEAGIASVTEPKVLALALEVRAKCRQVLRNPDGYEIWPNY